MYAEFSFDLVPGQHTNETVIAEIFKRFTDKPNGDPRLKCDLLSDTFLCEIVNTDDFDRTNRRLSRLRNDLGQQFNYSFSLRSRGDPIRVRGSFNKALASQIING